MKPTGSRAGELRIGGLEKLSLVDWPGMLAAVVFCQGCRWRCVYCHNPHLLPFGSPAGPPWADVLAWLGRRRGLLDGVVFSGGEATCQAGLGPAMQQARDLGFQIGLHTGGPSPEAIARILPLLDWVGFDFKAPFSAYARITGRDQGKRAQESLRLIREAGVPCEIRTTWHPSLLSADDLSAMAATLTENGCTEWVIQRFRPEGCPDAPLRGAAVGALPDFPGGCRGLRVKLR